MIRYALVCDSGHSFEGWFGASADFDDQASRGLLSCPVCGSPGVRKQIMAPAVSGTRKQDSGGLPANAQAMMMEALGRVRRHVEDNFDYVGDSFAAEARLIHEGKSEERGIYRGEGPGGRRRARCAAAPRSAEKDPDQLTRRLPFPRSGEGQTAKPSGWGSLSASANAGDDPIQPHPGCFASGPSP